MAADGAAPSRPCCARLGAWWLRRRRGVAGTLPGGDGRRGQTSATSGLATLASSGRRGPDLAPPRPDLLAPNSHDALLAYRCGGCLFRSPVAGKHRPPCNGGGRRDGGLHWLAPRVRWQAPYSRPGQEVMLQVRGLRVAVRHGVAMSLGRVLCSCDAVFVQAGHVCRLGDGIASESYAGTSRPRRR
ncbi:hypothetical protein SEVIR_2G323500v4 [Setaria viridis]|uniref:Uncharacterized protein n=1 Tax=Setaria viridis TaxID=4556 RepID=A0A4U6WAH6_SETVI|nr:hypothetical protein SEVIR_2G323500v2 [Setaria viridis]